MRPCAIACPCNTWNMQNFTYVDKCGSVFFFYILVLKYLTKCSGDMTIGTEFLVVTLVHWGVLGELPIYLTSPSTKCGYPLSMAYSKMYNDYLSKIFPNSSVLSVRGVDYGIVRVGGKVARRHDIRMSPPLCHDLQGPLANCVDIMHYRMLKWAVSPTV